MALSTAPNPSYITLPDCSPPSPTLLDFFDRHFPRVGRSVWEARILAGKVIDEQGRAVTLATPYRVNARLAYFREVAAETPIPFAETILYENDHILVADKPHFLPVTPSGGYVNECLLNRLIRATSCTALVPVHRLDRETAGLVLFTKSELRQPWFDLFRHGCIDKRYLAVATLPSERNRHEWQIESRIERGEPWHRFRNVPGAINARSGIRLLEQQGERGLYELVPHTGKTHQLRLHMQLIGATICGDRLYPDFRPPPASPDYSHPLQLLARTLAFLDPLSGQSMQFESRQMLAWPPAASGNESESDAPQSMQSFAE